MLTVHTEPGILKSSHVWSEVIISFQSIVQTKPHIRSRCFVQMAKEKDDIW